MTHTVRAGALIVLATVAIIAFPFAAGVVLAGNEIVEWGLHSPVPSPNTGFVAVAGGNHFSLGLKSDGSIVAWGDNANVMALPSPNTNFVAVAAGNYHGVGLKANGSIVAWGANDRGQLIAPTSSDFVAVSACGNYCLGLKSDGSIVAWGELTAVPTPNTGFVAVSAGGSTALGLKTDGSVVAWGASSVVPSPNSGFVAVAAGWYHRMALRSDGSIVAWGDNPHGQTDVPSPNTNFVALAAGGHHSLGIKSDGSIVGWGYNDYGQCNVPSPNTGFVAVAAGAWQSLGLRASVAPRYQVSGRVAAGTSPGGCMKDVYLRIDGPGYSSVTHTSDTGYYEFTDLSSGAFTITPVRQDGIFAPDDYWWSPAASMVTVGPASVADLNFTADSKSEPHVVIEGSPASYMPGVPFDVTLRLVNTNYAVEYASTYISLSSPQNPAIEVLEPHANGLAHSVYTAPWTVYHAPPDLASCGYSMQSSYVLVDGTRQGSHRNAPDEAWMTLRVTPPANLLSNLQLLYHASIGSRQDPVSGPENEQGFHVYAVSVPCGLPDLDAQSVEYSGAVVPQATGVVSYAILNTRPAPASSFDCRIVLSADQTINNNDTLLREWHINGIQPSEYYEDSQTVTFPDWLLPGTTYHIGLIVDYKGVAPFAPPGDVLETDETNNVLAEQLLTPSCFARAAYIQVNNSAGPLTMPYPSSITRQGTITGLGSGQVHYHWEYAACGSDDWQSVGLVHDVAMANGLASVDPATVDGPGAGCWKCRLIVSDPGEAISNSVQLNFQTSVRLLQVPYYASNNTDWCAVAGSAMIMRYCNADVTPKDVAAALSLRWDAGMSYPEMDSDTFACFAEAYGLTRRTEQYERLDWIENVRHLKDDLIASINSGHPVLLSIYDQLHSIVVVGISVTGVRVHDPSGAAMQAIYGTDVGANMSRIAADITWEQLRSLVNWSQPLSPGFATMVMEQAGHDERHATIEIRPGHWDGGAGGWDWPSSLYFVGSSHNHLKYSVQWDGRNARGYATMACGSDLESRQVDAVRGVVLRGDDEIYLGVRVSNGGTERESWSCSVILEEVGHEGQGVNFNGASVSLGPGEKYDDVAILGDGSIPGVTYVRIRDVMSIDSDMNSVQTLRVRAHMVRGDISEEVVYLVGVNGLGVSGVGGPAELAECGLSPVAPNPFNPSTTLSYSLAHESRVRLAVYDIGGRLVRHLIDEARSAGRYEARWDGTDDRGSCLASGVYFCRMEAGSFHETRRMTLVK